MRLFNALQDQFSRRVDAARAAPRSVAQSPLLRTLRLEALETRKLLSVNVAWNDGTGVLTITEGAQSGDIATVG